METAIPFIMFYHLENFQQFLLRIIKVMSNIKVYAPRQHRQYSDHHFFCWNTQANTKEFKVLSRSIRKKILTHQCYIDYDRKITFFQNWQIWLNLNLTGTAVKISCNTCLFLQKEEFISRALQSHVPQHRSLPGFLHVTCGHCFLAQSISPFEQ